MSADRCPAESRGLCGEPWCDGTAHASALWGWCDDVAWSCYVDGEPYRGPGIRICTEAEARAAVALDPTARVLIRATVGGAA